MGNQKKTVLILFFAFVFFYSCASLQIIKEPLLERTTVKSEPQCFSLFTFCRVGAPNSVLIKGFVENSSGNKSYFLEYYLSSFESDLPIGVSLKIDENYYNLKKASTEYSDYVMVESVLSPEILDKVLQSKNLSLSYSNRKDTLNIEFSNRARKKFQINIQKIKEALFSAEKLNIIK